MTTKIIYRPVQYDHVQASCHLLSDMRVCQICVQRPLISSSTLVQRHGDARESKQHEEVVKVQGCCLEDSLHEGYVNEPQLGNEGDGDGRDEHFVLHKPAAEAAVLDGRDKVEEYETCEGLRKVCQYVI